MKKLAALAILVIALSSSALHAQAPGYKEYYNPKLNFRFTYPQDWTVKDLKKGPAVLYLIAPADPGSNVRSSIYIFRQPLSPAANLTAWGEAQVPSLKNQFGNIEVITSGATTQNGKEAYSYNFSGTQNGSPVTVMRSSIVEGTDVITTMLIADPAKLAALAPAIQSITSSLKTPAN